MKGICPCSLLCRKIFISWFGLKKRWGIKKNKKILLTNKKSFIRPGLWFLWGARRKYLAFSNRMKKGSIPMKTFSSVCSSVIFLTSTLSSLTSSSYPCLYTSYFSNFLFSPVVNLPLSSFFNIPSSLILLISLLPLWPLFSIQVYQSSFFSPSFVPPLPHPSRLVMAVCAAWHYMRFH